jgi:tetraacyldisaccharide 4'-kinase
MANHLMESASTNSQPWYLNVMSGVERGPVAATLRAGLTMMEPLYAAAVGLRNRGFDRPGQARKLPRPVISVGNITAGGTGKTPIVRWLAEHLRSGGRNVAILSRGYKAARGSLGDEQRMLDRLLNGASFHSIEPVRPVLLYTDHYRHKAGQRALGDHPEIDVFLLDDGFQHRRLARDLDLVLIRATEPFGFGRVLPRGLLREPLSGLRRASAFILTHADGVDAAERERITGELRRHNPSAPIFAAIHAPVAVRSAPPGGTEQELSIGQLCGVRAFAFCGIANPQSFERELRSRCGKYVGHQWFADHHAYTPADVQAVQHAALKCGADVLITTEKDWAKLAELPEAGSGLPIWRLDVAATFLDGDDERLLERVEQIINVGRRST